LAGKNRTLYELDKNNTGILYFKEKQNPRDAWVFPVVTGHKYKISFGLAGLDFE